VLGAMSWSLQPIRRDRGGSGAELLNVERIAKAEDLERLPKEYLGLAPVSSPAPPVPGERPGDVDAAVLKAQSLPMQAAAPGPQDDPQQAERLAGEEAAKSSVFFRLGSSSAGGGGRAATKAAGPGAADPPVGPAADQPFSARSGALPVPTPAWDATAPQNHQERKEAFLINGGRDADAARNSAGLQPPASPYQVMAGTVIPAALVTGINSDLPGQVIASVTEGVRDTATGKHLLIPQGSRLIGRYDSQVAFGQRRVLLVWTRLILPDTSSIALDKLPGIDPAGYAGLEDGVDWHWGRVLASAALSTLLGAGAELAAPEDRIDGHRVVIAAREGLQDTVNQTGQELTRRSMNIQPTLTVRPGFAIRVMVTKDLVLRPYQPLFFVRGGSP
jgi:type IV secretory pathway VirB10-like protein